MVISLSENGGKTWEKEIIVEPGSAAYSDLVALSDTQVGILYEAENYQKIIYKHINIKKERPVVALFLRMAFGITTISIF